MPTYDVVVVHRTGTEHVHPYATDEALEPGELVRLEGRYWLIERIDGDRAHAKPARYRLRLRYPDGREDVGAFRRFRPGVSSARSRVRDGAGRATGQLGGRRRAARLRR